MKLKVPLDIHESTMEQWQERSDKGELVADPAISRLSDAIKTTRTNCSTLVGLSDALAQDWTNSPQASALKLRGHALRLAEATAQKLDAAKEAVQGEIDTIVAAIGTPPLPGTQYAVGLEQEIRSRLAAMPEKAREEAISKAFAAKDQTVIGAVLRGPAMLVGMSDERHAMVREHYRREFHPVEYARYRRLRGAMETMVRTGQSFLGFIGGVVNSESANLAEAAVANARAAEIAVQRAYEKEPTNAG